MLEGYFDFICVLIGYFAAYLIGVHFGETRGGYHFYLEEIIKRLPGKVAPPVPPIIHTGGVPVPKPPLPAFKEQEEGVKGRVKIDDYLGG